MALLVDGTDLNSWANRRDSQGVLPQLVRRLVHATTDSINRIGFPAGDGISIGGWDGIVSVSGENSFVPTGTSVWEMGTNKNIKGKADDDYEKRLQNPLGINTAETTYIFVTPRRWGGKDSWVNSRQKEGIWREVRAYDANDIEAWLELAPVVHIWFSVQLGKHPKHAMDLEGFWADWSGATRPALSAEFILSRSGVAERVIGWIGDPTNPLALKAELRDEAIAVFAAVIQQLPLEEKMNHLSRTVVVENLHAWRQIIAASEEPLILIPRFDDGDAISRALREKHRVVIPLGRSDSSHDTTFVIPKISSEAAAKTLEQIGIPRDKARGLATLARRSLAAFRRKLSISPEVRQPMWAKPTEARKMLPFLLVSSWNETYECDRDSIGMLVQSSYDQFKEILIRWVNEPDSPVRHVGDTWFIVSKEDCWELLGRYLVSEDLERLERVVLDVLGTPDSRFELPVKQRWKAGALGRTSVHSDRLKEGLAESLGILGVMGTEITLSLGVSVSDFVDRMVRRLLEVANADWRVWASLSNYLPVMAEASPDEFLDAVDSGLSGEEPVLLKIFNEGEDETFSFSPHTGLLWALETLSWSAEYLGRAALLLSKLARLNSSEKSSNRSQNSLREIFCLWHPQSAAGLVQRNRVLDSIRHRENDVAWPLLISLVPSLHETAVGTIKPRWRDWVSDDMSNAQAEFNVAVRELIKCLLQDVGERADRWEDIIEIMFQFPANQYEEAVDRLSNLNTDDFEQSDKIRIRDALCMVISHHRSASEAIWALTNEQLTYLEGIIDHFQPSDVFSKHAGVFAHNPCLTHVRRTDWQEYNAAIMDARTRSVAELYSDGGLESLLEFAHKVELPSALGVSLGSNACLALEQDDEIIGRHLSSEDPVLNQFARGFLSGRISLNGTKWADEKLSRGEVWSSIVIAEILLCLPSDHTTWRKVQTAGDEVERFYWASVNPYAVENFADLDFPTRKFLYVDYPYKAVILLSGQCRRQNIPSILVADTLDKLLATPVVNQSIDDSLSYHVSELLDLLDNSSDIEVARIARLEWGFIPILHGYGRAPRHLHRELSRNPEFFAEVISLVFRGSDDEPRELTSEEQFRARVGYDLISTWRTVPGLHGDGVLDASELQNWMNKSRTIVSSSGRAAIGDSVIGGVLGASPIGNDGFWPHEAIRDVIEDVASTDLERGFESAVYNSRGVVIKGHLDGGEQERELANLYEKRSSGVSDGWPRTASVLRRISASYRRDAQREDVNAELREDMGG